MVFDQNARASLDLRAICVSCAFAVTVAPASFARCEEASVRAFACPTSDFPRIDPGDSGSDNNHIVDFISTMWT
jgi:hypothetical protein